MAAFICGGMGTLVYNIIKLNQVFVDPERFVGANKFLTFFCKSELFSLCHVAATSQLT